jgi:formylglycine-generating enzyme required for sulfatase activity
MKPFKFLFLIAITIGCKPQYDVVRDTKHTLFQNPPGTVWLKDSIYIDQTEISNLAYLEYLNWLEKCNPENYYCALPDTTVWFEKSYYNAPFVSYYLRHPAYRNYPVVGVSYEQVANFCKWRTDRVQELYSTKLHHQKTFKIFEYRLPTKKEWEYAASGGVPFNHEFGFENIIGNNGKPKVWIKETYTLYGACRGYDIFIPVKNEYQNKFGLYNMIGNVSEMIMDKGVAKGGSVFNSLFDCAIKDSTTYTKPECYVGFRCVCIVKK